MSKPKSEAGLPEWRRKDVFKASDVPEWRRKDVPKDGYTLGEIIHHFVCEQTACALYTDAPSNRTWFPSDLTFIAIYKVNHPRWELQKKLHCKGGFTLLPRARGDLARGQDPTPLNNWPPANMAPRMAPIPVFVARNYSYNHLDPLRNNHFDYDSHYRIKSVKYRESQSNRPKEMSDNTYANKDTTAHCATEQGEDYFNMEAVVQLEKCHFSDPLAHLRPVAMNGGGMMHGTWDAANMRESLGKGSHGKENGTGCSTGSSKDSRRTSCNWRQLGNENDGRNGNYRRGNP
ncbi:hypothetical protein ACLMJK_008876 [Lecanora helva]